MLPDIELPVVGDSVHDMHDGAPDFLKIFGDVWEVETMIRLPLIDFGDVINATCKAHRFGDYYNYTNKMLTVMEATQERIVLAWSYDARSGGFYVLRRNPLASRCDICGGPNH